MALTPKQERFVGEYLIDLNGAAAAIRAGFAPRSAKVTASRLLTNVNLRCLIKQNRKLTAKKLEIQREDVVQGLRSTFEVAREDRDSRGMIAACAEINKMLGFYVEQIKDIDRKVADVMPIPRYCEMSDKQLLELVKGESTE